MTVISLPKILRERLTDEGADALVQILDKVEERSQEATLQIAEERFEKRLAQLDAKIDTVAAQLDAKIDTVRAEMRTEIAGTRADLIKWMFLFWVGQVGTITAILFAFFKR